MAMILLNSSDLLRVDLKGVNVILPDLVCALEAVLGDQVHDTRGQFHKSFNAGVFILARKLFWHLKRHFFGQQILSNMLPI